VLERAIQSLRLDAFTELTMDHSIPETARPNYNQPEAKPERQKPNNYNTKVRKIDIKNIHFYKKRFPCPGVPKRFLQIKNGYF